MNDFPSDFAVGCADEGQGRPLVLVHCSGADRHVWAKMLEAWDTAGQLESRRVLRPELFGCGATARWPGKRRLTLDDIAALIDRALADVAEPVDLVGHSFGGAVALSYALRRSERIRTLTLVEPSAFFLLKDSGVAETRLWTEIDAVAHTIRTGAAIGTVDSCETAMQCFFDYWNGEGRWQTLAAPLRQSMAKLADVIALDFAVLASEPARLADFRALQIPTLLVNGGRSPEPVRHIAALLEQTLPLAERIAIDQAGHMIPVTHAGDLARLIAAVQFSEGGSLVEFRRGLDRSPLLAAGS